MKGGSTSDTTLKAEWAQIDIFRRMKPEQRLKMAIELSETTRKLTEEGIKARHPEYSDDEVRLAIIKILLGDELFRLIYPHKKEIKP